MSKLRPYLTLVASNGKDFRDSVVMILLGFIIMFGIYPPRAYESHNRDFFAIYDYVLRYAGWFVFALTAFFCALNAYYDKKISERKKQVILRWIIALCIWMIFLFIHIGLWYSNLHESMKPAWLQSS